VLAMSVRAYGTPHYVRTVPARYFSPAPKVDSAIVHIADISKKRFDTLSEDRFFKVLKAGFGSKRKQLANNLSAYGGKDAVARTLEAMGLSRHARAEDLTIDAWCELATRIN